MSVVLRRGADCERVYAEMLPMMRTIAREWACSRGLDEREAYAEADLIFLQSLDSHDPQKGSLKSRVRSLLRHGLAHRKRLSDARRRALRRRFREDSSQFVPQVSTPKEFLFGSFTAPLTHDARAVLAILFDGPREFDAGICADPVPGPDSIRRHLRRWLRDNRGWSEKRIQSVFREIERAVAAI